jgi:hypothetical protein
MFANASVFGARRELTPIDFEAPSVEKLIFGGYLVFCLTR